MRTRDLLGKFGLCVGAAVLAVAYSAAPARAQQEEQPAASSEATDTTPSQGQPVTKPQPLVNPKNNRVGFIIPNYNTVEHPEAGFAPITVKEKFKLGAQASFDPY